MEQIKEDEIKGDKDLDIALKEYELATQHYFHEDKMKTDALRNSLLAIIAIFAAVATVISTENPANDALDKIKIWFSFALGLSGILISFSYGIQYRRILKYQEALEARLEEIERIIEDTSHFPIRTIRYGLELMDQKKLDRPKNKFIQHIKIGILESKSSSELFRILLPWFLIILWVVFALLLLFYRP